jgi:hypothetical protein
MLSTSIGCSKAEQFSYAAVIAAVDFLFLACEPLVVVTDTQPIPELIQEVKELVKILEEDGFSTIVSHLMPIYEAQKRSHRLLRILARFSSSQKLVNILDHLAKPLDPWGNTTLMRKLQMTSKHIVLCRALVKPPRQIIGWMKLLRNPVWGKSESRRRLPACGMPRGYERCQANKG